MEEIIAEKSRAAAYTFLALSAVGVLVASAGLFLLIKFHGYEDAVLTALKIAFTAGGGVIAVIFGGLFGAQLYKSFALAVLREGKIVFYDGSECSPDEITEISVEGKTITVGLSQRKVILSGVANLEKAHKKLSMLAGKPTAANNTIDEE